MKAEAPPSFYMGDKMNLDLKIGIIVADNDEYKPLAEYMENQGCKPYGFLGRTGHSFVIKGEKRNAHIFTLLCGIGKVNAAAAAAHFADIGCDIILNYGLSGGISGVRRGDITICDQFFEHDFDLTGIGYKPCEKPSQQYIYESDKRLIDIFKQVIPDLKQGTAITGDRFICEEKQRDYFKTAFGAMSCDMETAAIAYVASFAGIPFASLRRISDDAGADAECSYREMNTSDETLLSDYMIACIKAIIESENI